MLRRKFKDLFVLILFLFFGQSTFSQGLGHPLFNYKEFFNQENTSEINLQLIDSLENNWYCIRNKKEIYNQLILSVNQEEQIEYLNLLMAIDEFYKLNPYEGNSYLNHFRNKRNIILKGRLSIVKAIKYNILQDYANAIKELTNSIAYFENNKFGLISSYSQLILNFGALQDIENATEYFTKAIILSEKTNYNQGLYIIYKVYAKEIAKYDPEQAYELFKKSYSLVKNEKNSPWYVRNCVEYLRFLLRYKKGDEFLSVLKEVNDNLNNTCMYAHISVVQTFLSYYYSSQNMIDSSIFYNRKALYLRKLGGNELLSGYSYLNLAENYINKRELQEAKQMLDSSGAILYLNGNLRDQQNYLIKKIEYFELVKNKDSIITALNVLYDINNQYNVEQKQILAKNLESKNIFSLKLQKEKYELELSKRKNRLLYLIIISVLSIVLIIFLIVKLRSKNEIFKNLILGSKQDKQAIEAYQKEIEKLKEIFKNAAKGLLIIDKTMSIMYFNLSAQKLFNGNQELYLGNSIYSYISKENHNTLKLALDKTFDTKENQEIVIEIVNAIEQLLKLNISISPMLVNNEIESLLFIINDITESIDALEREKEQRRILQTLINSVTESIVLINDEYKIALLNQTAARRLESAEEELLGKDYFSSIPSSLRENRKAKLEEVFKNKKAIVFDEDIDSFLSMVSYYPNINKSGEVEFIAEFSQDVTERKLASEQINSLRQKVLRSQMNPHFIFNSLNAIQSYVLKNDASKAVKYLNSFARLIRMILDSSRFDYITLAKEVSILEHYLVLQQLRFGDKFLYKLEVDNNLVAESLLIPAMLAQPFIENAIEHGLQHLETKGTVEISFMRKDEGIEFKVIDNGIGREASKKIQENNMQKGNSLSTQLFKERLFTFNKFSGKKITYKIIDLKDNNGSAKGTMVVINLPLLYKSDMNII